ncbi:type II toxin-antitoxin system MqsA family antitoxin [Chitinophaga pollutisoli]|uniref:Type II toxin-antitoxin system MqsA family antitoxin n=1 Tax=Chitinophaga pollutisoli TaxID=3133966 RepID=A0ABZ2YSS1_9BACT
MECSFCNQGVMGEGLKDIVLQNGNAVIVVHGIPAMVCSHCGHYDLPKEVQEELEKITREILQRDAHMKMFRMRKGEA